MEFLKSVRRKSFISEVVYYGLNISLALTLTLIISLTNSLFFALLVFVISKWRVFAIRPRFWFVHLQSNLVDYIVGISIIILMYLANSSSVDDLQKYSVLGFYTLIFIGWLVYIKPKSKRVFMHIQAAIALYLGVVSIYSIGYEWSSGVVVFAMAVVGYAAARHMLSSYEERNIILLSLVWGFVTAELGWLVYHWTVAYTPLGVGAFIFPRAALTVVCIGLIAEKAYDSFHKHNRIRMNDILMPIVFTLAVTLLLPILLSLFGPDVAIGL